MPECPVCRRAFDGRFAVFAPPRAEVYDTIDCARRAARLGDDQLGGGDGPATSPLILPTIDVLTSLGGQVRAARARSPLGAGFRRRVRVPAVVAAGLSLVAAGSASSLYLWSGLPESANQATRTAAPALTPPSAPAVGSNEVTAPITPQGPRTREHPQTIAEIVPKQRAAAADVGTEATEPRTSEAPEPQAPPEPSTQLSPEPSLPPAAPSQVPEPPKSRPQPPPGGTGPTVVGETPPADIQSAPTREPAHSSGATEGGEAAGKSKKPKKPNPNPHPSPPVPPAPPEHAEGNGYGADGNQAGGQGNGGGNGNANGQAKGKDK